MSDYYSTLGLSKTATQDEIKQAYRKLAMKHHPDRTGGDDTEFKKIQEAYATLSDPEKRSQYDNPQPQGFQQFGGMPPGFEDIMSQMFGGGNPFGFGGMGGQRPARNRTLNMQTQISLEDAFFGKDLIANITLPNGHEQVVNVKIPRGIQDGTTLRLAKMGDDSYANLPRGDIHLTVNIIPNNKFNRQGDDLIKELEVNAIDAILGKNYQLETIDNRILEVKINPGTQHGQMLAAAGYGMPNMNDNRFVGRLLIQVKIQIPTDLTNSQLTKLREIYN
jgi:DnaJ-class molecular chaperone